MDNKALISELETKIEKMKKVVADPATPENTRKMIQFGLDKAEKQLAELKQSMKEVEKATEKIEEAKKDSEKAPAAPSSKKTLRKEVSQAMAKLKEKKTAAQKQVVKASSDLKKTSKTLSDLVKANPKLKAIYSGLSEKELRDDAGRPAKKPGKRISSTGKTYYEHRPNRVDITRSKKGPLLEEGGQVKNPKYWAEYESFSDGSGELNGSVSFDFNVAYRDAMAFKQKEKKAGRLDDYTWIGVNGQGDRFAIVHATKDYIDSLRDFHFKSPENFKIYKGVAEKCLETGKPQKGSYAVMHEQGGKTSKSRYAGHKVYFGIYRNRYVVVSADKGDSENMLWANEYFKDLDEAKQFAKDNEFEVVSDTVVKYDKKTMGETIGGQIIFTPPTDIKKETGGEIHDQIWLSVDGNDPVTYEQFYSENTAEDVEPLTEEEFAEIKSLKVGETWGGGGASGVEVKRVSAPGENEDQDEPEPERELLLDGNRGIYIPKDFYDHFDFAKYGLKKEDYEELSSPDNEFYWEAWDDLLSDAATPEGHYLEQEDGDLWLVKPKSHESGGELNMMDQVYAAGGEIDGIDLEDVYKGYASAALWSTNDIDTDEPLDQNYSSLYDICHAAKVEMKRDVEKFVKENSQALKESGLDDEQIGHDFWLTRNGHGAGFWDRGLEKNISEQLTKSAGSFKTVDLYVGDDGMIHSMSEKKTMETGGKIAKPNYVSGKFSIYEKEYQGYHDPSINWNGFATPVFEKNAALEILKDEKIKHQSKNGELFADISGEMQKIGPRTIEVSGKKVEVYDIGAFSWSWELAGNGENDERQKLFDAVKSLGIDDYTLHDIRTSDEVFQDPLSNDPDPIEDFGIAVKDFTVSDIKKVLKSGEITVFACVPIKPGIFVTPSKEIAKEGEIYPDKGKIYSKKINLSSIAWISLLHGVYVDKLKG